MEARELCRHAIESLLESRSRALVTWLAVFWASAGTVFLVACGLGFRDYMLAQLREYGRGSLNVTGGVTSSGYPGYPVGRKVRISRSAAARAEAEAAGIEAILPVHLREEGYSLLTAGRRQRWYQLDGVDERYLWYRNFRVREGRELTAADVAQSRRVAVLGHDVAVELFGSAEAATGARIAIDGHAFQVIGVCDGKPRQYVNPGRPDNRLVLVPISAAEDALGFDPEDVERLLVYPRLADGRSAMERVLGVLGPEAGFHPDDLDAISWQDTRRLSRAVDLISAGFIGFVALAGSVTLLVAGVGVALFQLSTLASRVREIGILKAIGARNRTLVAQSVAESLLLTGSGVVLGTVFAVAGTEALAVLARARSLPEPRVSLALGIAVGVALVAVGCAAALLPALRVRRMEPSAALRSA